MNITATSYVTDETQHESKPNADINSCQPDLQFFFMILGEENEKRRKGGSTQIEILAHRINNLSSIRTDGVYHIKLKLQAIVYV